MDDKYNYLEIVYRKFFLKKANINYLKNHVFFLGKLRESWFANVLFSNRPELIVLSPPSALNLHTLTRHVTQLIIARPHASRPRSVAAVARPVALRARHDRVQVRHRAAAAGQEMMGEAKLEDFILLDLCIRELLHDPQELSNAYTYK